MDTFKYIVFNDENMEKITALLKKDGHTLDSSRGLDKITIRFSNGAIRIAEEGYYLVNSKVVLPPWEFNILRNSVYAPQVFIIEPNDSILIYTIDFVRNTASSLMLTFNKSIMLFEVWGFNQEYRYMEAYTGKLLFFDVSDAINFILNGNHHRNHKRLRGYIPKLETYYEKEESE